MDAPILKGGTALIDVDDFLKKLSIGSGQTIADLGCGGGGHFVAPTAALVGTAGLVYAVDIQKKVLNSLEVSLKLQNIGNVKLVWSDLEKVGAADVPNDSCDGAILANILFQNKDQGSILEEAARMLKKGGTMVVVDWKMNPSPFGPPTELRVAPERVRMLAEQKGLQYKYLFDIGAYHYSILFVK